MAKVLHWVAQGNGEITVNRCFPLENWTGLVYFTAVPKPLMVGPEGAKVYEVSCPAAGVFGGRDIHPGSYTSTLGPVDDINAVFTFSTWVLGYKTTIGRGFEMDIGDVVGANVTLSDTWQLVTASGTTASSGYTFLDFGAGTGAVGDVFYMTQPQLEKRAWRSKLVVPVGTGRDTTRTTYVGDESGNGRTGSSTSILTAPRWVTGTGIPSGSAWQFRNQVHMIDGPDFGSPTNVTVALWYRWNGAGPQEAVQTLFSKGFVNLEMSLFDSGALWTGIYVNGVRQTLSSGSGITDGNWHHFGLTYDGTTLRAYIDGAQSGALTVPGTAGISGVCAVGRLTGGGYGTNGDIADVRVYSHVLTPAEVSDLAKVKGRFLPSLSKAQAGEFVETAGNYKASLIDYSTWVLGSTGSQPKFGRNGDEAENNIQVDDNPWGRSDIIWNSTASGNGNDDGGWWGDAFMVDETKDYRWTVWIRKKVGSMTDSNSGRAYLGSSAYDAAVAGINIRLNDGTAPGNFYFMYPLSPDGMGLMEWRLFVGVIKKSSTSIPTTNHPDLGIWKLDGTQDTTYGWLGGVMAVGTKYMIHRAYQYYANVAGSRQQFYRPRVDALDGTEPSLQTLLRGDENPDLYQANKEKASFDNRARALFGNLDDTGTGVSVKRRPSGLALVSGGMTESIL